MALSETQKSFFRNAYGDFWPFLQAMDVDRSALHEQLERQCLDLGVYSIGPWFGSLLNFLTRFGGVTSALEFGTAIGYSAIWIAQGLAPGGLLTTIERSTKLVSLAQANLDRAGLRDRVEIRHGDAHTVAPTLQGPYDMIFVDCAHPTALVVSKRALREGGLFVCDNIGFSYLESFNRELLASPHLQTLYLQCYLKGRTPENTAFSVSIRR
jgi:caffeoyl-CoA O-methyltransferase